MSAFYLYNDQGQRKITGFIRIHISQSVDGERRLHIDYKDGRSENIPLSECNICSIWEK